MEQSLKEFAIERQYTLPSSLYIYAERYPHVNFAQALELYTLAVRTVIVTSGEPDLYSGKLSFGRGRVMAQKQWLRWMDEAEKSKGDK